MFKEKSTVNSKLVSLVPADVARQYNIAPLELRDGCLVIAIENQKNYMLLNELRLKTGIQIIPKKLNRADIQQIILQLYPSDISLDNFSFENEEIENAQIEEDDSAPIIRLVNDLIFNAIERGASDIHFDPQEQEMIVRVRIDGELRELKVLPGSLKSQVVSRLKIISSLNITETRIPQDGRGIFKNGYHVTDLRISILPTVHGEKVVIRIIDRAVGIRSLEKFGFSTSNLNKLKHLLAQPHGIILVTGPTGSGKSSTLYAALNTLNNPNINIITVEDPVEYQVPGINQVAVNKDVGLTFASGLRSILRQDPDVIMLGEIRDTETAEIAIRASMTGHLVLSTIHTNDSISTVNRLVDMQIEPFLVSSSLAGILSQRLVRTICQDCRVERAASFEENNILEKHQLHSSILFEGRGCSKCDFTGYRGRIAIHELLVVTDELRKKISQQETDENIKQYLEKQNMEFLINDGFSKVLSGDTTIEEVLKVVV